MDKNVKVGLMIIFVCSILIYMSSLDPIFNRITSDPCRIKFLQPQLLPQTPHQPPLCINMLSNLTEGKWIKKINFVKYSDSEYQNLLLKEKQLDLHLTEFRIKRGIHTRLWRDDKKCGYKNIQVKPKGNRWGGEVGGWCDVQSSSPCCSNKFGGECGHICNCTNCIDMRNIYHAEVSEWIPSDSRCRRRNYTSSQSCDVINKFSEILFVGDSFVGKMARAFVLILRSDSVYGTIAKHHNEHLRKFCVGLDQFYWTECRFPPGVLNDITLNNASFCGVPNSPNIIHHGFYSNQYAIEFLSVVKSLSGKKNTVMFVGVGAHDGCNAQLTQKIYFEPAVRYLEQYYKQHHTNETKYTQRWPHIVFMYPDTPGLLKAAEYQVKNGKAICDKFSREMKQYCDLHNISVLDFSKVTSGVHSYDGTHHGIGVNIMKIQIMLNYLDLISKNTITVGLL